MPITTTVTTSSSGTTTTVDVRVDDSGPGGGDRYIDIVLVFDPTNLEFDLPLPGNQTDIDSTRTNIWWYTLLEGTSYVERTVKVKPRNGIPFIGSSTAKLIVLDAVNSDMISQTFYVGGGPSIPLSMPTDRSDMLVPQRKPTKNTKPKVKPKGPKPKKPARGPR